MQVSSLNKKNRRSEGRDDFISFLFSFLSIQIASNVVTYLIVLLEYRMEWRKLNTVTEYGLCMLMHDSVNKGCEQERSGCSL